jgi:hypothetical protein
MSVTLRLPRRSSIFFVHRTTTQRTYQPAASGSRCDPVLVDQPAEDVLAAHVKRRHSSSSLDGAVRRFEPEGPVRPVPVVVTHIDTQDTFEVSATEDQEMIEAVGAHGAHPTLRVSVRVRRPYRRPDHPDTLGTKDLVEPALNFEPRSWIISRNGRSSPRFIIKLRACCAVHPPSGFECTRHTRSSASQARRRTARRSAAETPSQRSGSRTRGVLAAC